MSGWQRVAPGVLCCRDAYSVYAVECPEGTFVVESGTEGWRRWL